MSQAVPFIAKWIAGKFVALTGSAAIGNTVYVVATAALYAAPAVLAQQSAARQAKKAQRALATLAEQGVTATFADPVASAKIVYGEMRVGGTTVFAHTNGTKNETLHMVVVHCLDGVSELGEVYYGDEALGMPWNGGSPPNTPDAGSRFYGYVQVNKKVTGGAADADLVTAAPTKWTTDHKLTGLCSTYHKLTWNADVFPQGASFNISVMVKGRPCYDPRTATTAWTSNPALVLRDYLVTYAGFSSGEINDTDVIAAANICDETVTLADSSTAARYTCNLVLDTADDPGDNIRKIVACMAGWADKVDATWRVKAGAHESSALSLTIDDLIGEIAFQAQDDVAQSCNGIRAIYVAPQNNWQPADAAPVYKIVTAPNITAGTRCTILSVGTTNFTSIGAASNTVGVTFTASGAGTGTGTVDPYLGQDNGVRRWRDIELYGTTNHAEARRLMRIELERARHELTVRTTCSLRAILCQVGDTVDLTVARLGWTNKLFQVVEHETRQEAIAGDGDEDPGGVFTPVDLVLREISSAIYDRTAADETTADAAPNTDMQRPWEIAAPTSLVLASGTTELVKLKDGTVLERLKASWTAPADPYVTGGGRIEVAYKKSADTPWLPSEYVPGDATLHYMSPVIQGTNYDVRVRSINPLGVTSDWVAVTAHTLVGKTAAPNPVTDLTATAAPGAILLKWTNPTDVDLLGVQIYQNATNSKPASPAFWVAAPGNTYTHDGLSGGDVRYYWVVAVDTTINISTDATANATAEDTTSPTLMHRGVFAGTDTYYDNEDIKNVVSVSGTYYKANNAAKDGLATWTSPPSSDWEVLAPQPLNTATAVLSGSGELATSINSSEIKFTSRAKFAEGHAGESTFSFFRKAGDPVGDMGLVMTHGGTEFLLQMGAVAIAAGPYVPTFQVTASTGAMTVGAVTSGAIGMTGALTIGGDCNLYRASANQLRTNDSLTIDGALAVGTFAPTNMAIGAGAVYLWESGGNLKIGSSGSTIDRSIEASAIYAIAAGSLNIGSDCAFYRHAADVIRTSDSLTVDGTLTVGTFSATSLAAANSVAVGSSTVTYMYPTANGARFGSTLLTQDRDVEARSVYAVSTGSLGIGADCSFYRHAADVIRTADSLTVDGTLTVGTFSGTTITASTAFVVGTSTPAYIYDAGSSIVRFGSTLLTQDRTINALSIYAAATGYLGVGADCEWYRAAANQWRTDDAVILTDKLYFGSGGDVNLYRGGADALKTDDALSVENSVTIVGTSATLTFSTDCSIYRAAADSLRTGDSFKVDGVLECAGNGLLLSQTENTYIYNIGSGVVRFGSSLITRGRGLDAESLATAAPSGSSSGTWKFGAANSVNPTSPNRTLVVDIGGTVYYIAAKTSND